MVVRVWLSVVRFWAVRLVGRLGRRRWSSLLSERGMVEGEGTSRALVAGPECMKMTRANSEQT